MSNNYLIVKVTLPYANNKTQNKTQIPDWITHILIIIIRTAVLLTEATASLHVSYIGAAFSTHKSVICLQQRDATYLCEAVFIK